MKKILSILAMAFFALAICAQEKDITTFLGIPIDGFKPEMKKKLIAKGFTYNTQADFFEGEFNGHEVQVFIATNNNKVYRIMLYDAHGQDEANIKIRFNKLVDQFKKNNRYFTPDDYTLSDDEDISYEMLVHKKIYEAVFYQKPKDYEALIPLTEEEAIQATKAMEPAFKKPVWFRICENYGKYYIAMYYDNKYNEANGDDL